MKPLVTTSIILDTRREKLNKKYPVKLCVNNITKAKYYSTRIDLTETEFQALFAKRLTRESIAIKNELHTIEAEARDTIRILKPFSFSAFEKRLGQRPAQQGQLAFLFHQEINKLTNEERLGTASSYQCAINSLTSFKENIALEHITVDFLNEYEKWMIETKGASITTVGIYLRAVRAIFNEAIGLSLIPNENYPFGKRKYQIPTGRNIKKALSMTDIAKLYYYEPDAANEMEARAKDFWLFTYFGNGINMKDIALLKYKNIQGEYIVFERAKTNRTSRTNPRPITIYINPEMRQVISKWGNLPDREENYIFPILNPTADAFHKRKQIQQFTKLTNKWTKRMAEKLNIPMKVTTYTARHSFSTVLKRSGASTEFISEALGHTNLKTTLSYLDSFENETKKQFSFHLTRFKGENVTHVS
ncbi:MAG: site-specific integrase [Ginsengibacter sp.]